MKPEKTEQGLLIGGGNCLFSIPDIAYENMMQTKQIWGKQEGRQAYHYVISLDKGEGNSEVMMDLLLDYKYYEQFKIMLKNAKKSKLL